MKTTKIPTLSKILALGILPILAILLFSCDSRSHTSTAPPDSAVPEAAPGVPATVPEVPATVPEKGSEGLVRKIPEEFKGVPEQTNRIVPSVSHGSSTFEPKSSEECLNATVRIRNTDSSGKTWYGSGFFLNEGESTYIYTNAHVIDAAEQIDILDNSNAKVTDIEWIEAFATPFGRSDKAESGDGVRMKLAKRRDVAFTMATDWQTLTAGRQLIVFGDNYGPTDGKGIETLKGPLLSIDNGVIK